MSIFGAIDQTTRKPVNFVVDSSIDALLVKVVSGGGGGGGGGDASAANQVTQTARLTTLVSQTDGIEASLTSIDGKTPALVSGAVPVSITNSAALTDTQLRATPVPVSVSGVATEATLAAINTKAPALGAALTAASVPVNIASDQSVNVVQAVPNSSGNITTQNLVPGGAATAGSAVELTLAGAGAVEFQVQGTYTGALSFQVTVDGTNWTTLAGSPLLVLATGGGGSTVTSAAQGVYAAACPGALKCRVTALAAVTGTAVISIRAAQGGGILAQVMNTLSVVGSGGHSAAAANGHIRSGSRVLTAVDTTLVNGDGSDLIATTNGAITVKPFSIPDADWQYAAASGGIVNTTDVAVKAAAGAGLRNYVTGASIQNSSAVATEVVIKDGSTVIWRGFVGAAAALSSVIGVTFPTPLKGTANTAINVACITTASAVYVNLQGFSAP